MSSRKILITGIFLRVSTLGRACLTKGQVSMDFHTERNSLKKIFYVTDYLLLSAFSRFYSHSIVLGGLEEMS
jgi:hypothetical protein